MPHTLTHSQTTEYRATQLLYSIQFKLSHAIALLVLMLIRHLLLLHSELVLEQLEEGAGLLVVREIVDRPHHHASVWWTWHLA